MAWNADSMKRHRCGTSIAVASVVVRGLAASSLHATDPTVAFHGQDTR